MQGYMSAVDTVQGQPKQAAWSSSCLPALQLLHSSITDWCARWALRSDLGSYKQSPKE